ARAGETEIVRGVIPDGREVARRLIDRDLRQELAIGSTIVVGPHRCAPAGALVVGVTHPGVQIVAPVLHLERVDEIDAASMWTIAAIPRQSRLGVDRSIRLGGNEIEAANMGVGDERTVLECAADAGWIEAGEDL